MATGAAPSTRRSPAALLALATAALDLGVLAVLHLAQPEVDVWTTATSAYVHGAGGWLSPVATAAAGVGALALMIALRGHLAGSRATVGLVLLAIFGLAKSVQAFFPIDADGESTSAGMAHNVLGNVAFFVLPVAAILLGGVAARATRRRSSSALALVVALTTAAVLVAGPLDAFGLAQRIYLISAALWVAVTAWACLAPRSGERQRHAAAR